MKKILIIVISFLLVANGFSQNEDSIMIKKISDEILTNGKAYDNLHDLTKKIGGRLSGSPQMVKAEKWGAGLLQESGADKAWLQECMVPHWVRGGKDKADVLYNGAVTGARNVLLFHKQLDVLALGNSEGTKNKDLTAKVVLVNSFDELEKKKDSLKGMIVFYDYKFNPTYVQTFRSYGEASTYRGSGPSRAAKYGAAAVIVRSMSHSVDNNPHTGATRYDSAYAKIPALAVGLRDADWLSKKIGENRIISLTIKTNAHFLPDTIGHNVIGELTGSDFPNEIITIGGH